MGPVISMRRRTSKVTNPMTPLGPVPFVGRSRELAELKGDLAVVPLVSLHGALGSGKTRLVGELAAWCAERRIARVSDLVGTLKTRPREDHRFA